MLKVEIMISTIVLCIVIVLIDMGGSIQATIFDNRYVPFLQRPYIVAQGKDSCATIDTFFATASQAFGKNDNLIGVPELNGLYNQSAVAKSFVSLGCNNPLPSRYQDKERIIWQIDGKLVAQGIEFAVHKKLYDHYYAGFYWYFMRVNSSSAFFLNLTESGLTNISASDVLLLDRTRREMNVLAGLTTSDHASQVGMGDLDAYVMYSNDWYHILKCRSIRAQASVGGLFPAGPASNIFKPTSIPFAGDGFWGAYVAAQGEFELKEDLRVGLFTRVSKRFSRVKLERLPLHAEPMQYAPFISLIDINPGPTFVFMAWAGIENVHKGLGARLLLTIRKHWKDSWEPCSSKCCSCINVCALEELTEWGSDYITLNVFYDFSKEKVRQDHSPIVFFAWDIPSNLLMTQNALKTNKVILGMEMSF